MTRDIELLTNILEVFLGVAAVCTTLFPLIWAFSRWWSTLLGRLLMLQSVALAAAVDVTAWFTFWPPEVDLFTLFLIQVVVFGLIALASVLLTFAMIRLNYFRRKKNQEIQNGK